MAEIDRSKAPDPTGAVPGGGEQDARGFAARLEPDRAPDAAGRRPERAARPHRRRGLREPGHVRRPHQHAELHAHGRGGPSVQPVPRHGTVLADPGGAADRPQQPRRRLRLDRRVRRRVPGLLRDAATGLRSAAPDPPGQRLQHGRVRQVAPDARRPAGSGRTVRPLAERLGLRLLLRLPRRRREPVGPVPGGEPEDHRDAAGVLRRGRPLLPSGRHGRQDDRVAPRRAGPGREEAVLRLLLDGLQPRAAPRSPGVGGQVQGEVRPGLGQAPRGDLRPTEGTRRRFRPTPS